MLEKILEKQVLLGSTLSPDGYKIVSALKTDVQNAILFLKNSALSPSDKFLWRSLRYRIAGIQEQLSYVNNFDYGIEKIDPFTLNDLNSAADDILGYQAGFKDAN